MSVSVRSLNQSFSDQHPNQLQVDLATLAPVLQTTSAAAGYVPEAQRKKRLLEKVADFIFFAKFLNLV
jgi:hypothetical protein